APPLVVADPDFDLGGSVPGFVRGEPFRTLSGTRREGEDIAHLLNVEPLLGPHAMKSAIMGRRSPRILHLATHGFFLRGQPHDPNQEQAEPGAIVLRPDGQLGRLAGIENPLLRSGLALAGANAWLQEQPLPAEAEDGLLSAEDVI